MKQIIRKIRYWTKWAVLFVLIALLVGCSAANASDQHNPALARPVRQDENMIMAEGTIWPARWRALSLGLPGQVMDIPVQAGQSVQAGDLLARLDTADLELALAGAEQNVMARQAALQQLLDGVGAATTARADKAHTDRLAQARSWLAQRELQLEQGRVQSPDAALAAAQSRVAQARLALAQTQAAAPTTAIALAQIELERARIALNSTQDEYNKALDRSWEDVKIRDGWARQLEQAQLNYRAAQARLDQARAAQQAHDLGLSLLSAQVDEAEAGYAQALAAQQAYTITLRILENQVEEARQSLAALEKDDNPYRDAPSAAQIAQAQAAVEQARLTVAQIARQIQDARLIAPFDGVVAQIDVQSGDRVAAGQVLMIIADLNRLQVRTTDLTELGMTRVQVGQPATLRPDALPDWVLVGTVTEIALRSGNYRGDVVYEVILDVEPTADQERLRWGMTVSVQIAP